VGGAENLTVGFVDKHVGRIEKMLSRMGVPGEGIRVIRSDDPLTENAAASAFQNNGFMTIYDGYFSDSGGSKRSADGGYKVTHEVGHEALGFTDFLPEGARDLVDGKSFSTYKGRVTGYRSAGAAEALRYGLTQHNDLFICSMGFSAC
jgi:hypothetical protein